MESEHRDEVVGKPGEVDLLAAIDVVARHVVVREEVDAEGPLEQGQHGLVDIQVEGQFRWEVNQRH